MARAIAVTLVGTVLLLLTLLWREHQHARDLEARVKETEMQLARATEAAVTKRPPTPVATNSEDTARTVMPAPITPSVSPAARTFSEAERGFRKGVDEQRRWTVLGKKTELLAAMNLPPDKNAALKDLLVERDYAEKDARDAARRAGLQPHEAAAAEVAKIDARLQAILGAVTTLATRNKSRFPCSAINWTVLQFPAVWSMRALPWPRTRWLGSPV